MRTSRQGGTYVHVVLQDASGTIAGRILEGVDRLQDEFDAGEFVRAQARADRHNQRLELVIEAIRRVNPEQDRKDGFAEGDYVQAAPRAVRRDVAGAAGAGRPGRERRTSAACSRPSSRSMASGCGCGRRR